MFRGKRSGHGLRDTLTTIKARGGIYPPVLRDTLELFGVSLKAEKPADLKQFNYAVVKLYGNAEKTATTPDF